MRKFKILDMVQRVNDAARPETHGVRGTVGTVVDFDNWGYIRVHTPSNGMTFWTDPQSWVRTAVPTDKGIEEMIG
jgi:hypothetical protein